MFSVFNSLISRTRLNLWRWWVRRAYRLERDSCFAEWKKNNPLLARIDFDPITGNEVRIVVIHSRLGPFCPLSGVPTGPMTCSIRARFTGLYRNYEEPDEKTFEQLRSNVEAYYGEHPSSLPSGRPKTLASYCDFEDEY